MMDGWFVRKHVEQVKNTGKIKIICKDLCVSLVLLYIANMMHGAYNVKLYLLLVGRNIQMLSVLHSKLIFCHFFFYKTRHVLCQIHTTHTLQPTVLISIPFSYIYVVGSKRFRPDTQKPRQMENAVRDI